MSLFQRMFEALPSENTNRTTISQVPAQLLESFVPGYAVISKLILNSSGVDITGIGSLSLTAFLSFTAASYLLGHVRRYCDEYLTSSVCIEENDLLFDSFVAWLAAQESTTAARKLMVKAGFSRYRSDESDDYEPTSQTEDDKPRWINYSSRVALEPTQYMPDRGFYWFFWSHHLFWMDRQQKTMVYGGNNGSTWFGHRDTLRIKTIGTSTRPIKNLIQEVKQSRGKHNKSRTQVMRPQADGPTQKEWRTIATRPSRPVETVILDQRQKDDVLDDINEFLHPRTAKWYAARGIPFRRGYLFHGPPGSGKSSFAWAIAGVFGLGIYCISLADPSLTEDQLGFLFSELPGRCVVLLEDIDTAGLEKREKMVDATGDKTKTGVTLSGLLNVIDGVAAQEGRVLVMTTNFIDNLDDALIRPGRIDRKVAFTLAATEQIAELFVRMYSLDNDIPQTRSKQPQEATPKPRQPSASTIDLAKVLMPDLTEDQWSLLSDSFKDLHNLQDDQPRKTDPEKHDSPALSPVSPVLPPLTVHHGPQIPTDLKSIAHTFASQLPSLTFSPAEIQGFLLIHKKDPLKALAEVASWRDGVLASKVKKANTKREEEMKTNRSSVNSELTKVGAEEAPG